MKRIQSLLTLAFALATVAVNAQDKLHVKGKVLSTKNTPIEFTSVLLENKEDGAVIEVIADEKGDFILEAPEGKYILIIEPLGYGPVEKEIEILSDLDLGTFAIKSSETVSLATAVIKAEKPVYKVELDKKVYDMSSDPMSQGLSLSDALQNVPSVQVDAEGGVSLRGNDNVKFLIDGKPSGMLGVSDVGEALKNIPAETVERIEVITNPSSRYEASGSAGIINIVLKKGSNTGFNGSVTGNGGLPDMGGVNTSLNYKTKKYNVYTNLGYRYSERQGGGSALTTNYPDGNITDYRKTDTSRNGIRRNYTARLGGEYYLNDNNTIGASAGYRYNRGNNAIDVDYMYYTPTWSLTDLILRRERSKEDQNTFDADINYKHEFDKKGHELLFTGRYSTTKEDKDGLIRQYTGEDNIFNQNDLNSTYDYSKQNSAVFTADYVKPFGEKGKFELGARVDLNTTKTNKGNNDIAEDGTLTPNLTFLTNIENQQNVYAGYAQYGNAIGKFQYFLGLRIESSDIKIKNQVDNSTIDKKYTDWFPSATLNYSFTDKNQLQFSYSRRVRRPMGHMLIPYFSSTNILDIRRGNPDLNPTYTNSFEFSYITSLGKLMITPSLFYQKSTGTINDFQWYNYLLDSGTYNQAFETMPVNAGTEDRYGLDLTSTYKPFKWWNLMLNLNLFGYDRSGSYSRVVDDYLNPETGITEVKTFTQSFKGNGFSSRGRLSSNFILPADVKLQLAANYMGGIKTAQQEVKANFSMDFSASKDLWNNRASISFNVRDLLNSRKREMTTFYEGSENYNSMRWMKRSASISFTYRFKNVKEKPKGGKRPEGMENEDMREGGGEM